jgi:two-component system CheB/CheR fusion protein
LRYPSRRKGPAGCKGEKEAILLSGRDLFVSARSAVVFGMIFHELATNAAKYGALADGAGSVNVKWRTEGDGDSGTFLLEWRERGGPAARAEHKRGFGINFIERSVAYELRGAAEMRFDSAGLHAMIRAPLSEVVGEAGPQ